MRFLVTTHAGPKSEGSRNVALANSPFPIHFPLAALPPKSFPHNPGILKECRGIDFDCCSCLEIFQLLSSFHSSQLPPRRTQAPSQLITASPKRDSSSFTKSTDPLATNITYFSNPSYRLISSVDSLTKPFTPCLLADPLAPARPNLHLPFLSTHTRQDPQILSPGQREILDRTTNCRLRKDLQLKDRNLSRESTRTRRATSLKRASVSVAATTTMTTWSRRLTKTMTKRKVKKK